MSVFLKLTRKVNDTPVLKKHHTGAIHSFHSLVKWYWYGLKKQKNAFCFKHLFYFQRFQKCCGETEHCQKRIYEDQLLGLGRTRSLESWDMAHIESCGNMLTL